MGEKELLLQETVLVVDDTPDNIAILSTILKKKYRVLAANNGETALKILKNEKNVDLVVLDILMPGLSGYDVCRAIKNDPSLTDIPVLFASSLSEIEEIVKGFKVGAVDYIIKPYQKEEIFARVKVHLELKKAKNEIQTLLSKTLLGSLKLMMEILTINQPQLVQQSTRVKRYVKDILPKLKLSQPDALAIELAAMLSHIGCISMPSEIMRKVFAGTKLSVEETSRYLQFPETGARLVENIPRLEKPAAIIRNQLVPVKSLPFAPNQVEFIGSILLNVLASFDVLINQGVEEEYALTRLKMMFLDCPPVLFNALREVLAEAKDSPQQYLPVEALQSGMILAEDVKLRDGHLLLPRGTELTDNLVELVQRFSKQGLCAMKVILVYHRAFSMV